MSIEWWQIILGLMGTSGVTVLISHLLDRPKSKSDIVKIFSETAKNLVEMANEQNAKQVAEIQGDLDAMKTELKRRDSETVAMQVEMNTLKSENLSQKKEIQILRTDIERKNRQIDNLNSQVKDLFLLLRQNGIEPPNEKRK